MSEQFFHDPLLCGNFQNKKPSLILGGRKLWSPHIKPDKEFLFFWTKDLKSFSFDLIKCTLGFFFCIAHYVRFQEMYNICIGLIFLRYITILLYGSVFPKFFKNGSGIKRLIPMCYWLIPTSHCLPFLQYTCKLK